MANAYILFIAGFETVSTSMSFCLYELALRRDVQDKVRNEIAEVKSKYNGVMSSECVNDLRYMGMVIKGKNRRRADVPFGAFVCRTVNHARVPTAHGRTYNVDCVIVVSRGISRNGKTDILRLIVRRVFIGELYFRLEFE